MIDFLCHYFDKNIGPFVSLSELSIGEANTVLNMIKQTRPNSQSASRDIEYMNRRHYYEGIIKEEFIKKGGVVKRNTPHFMVVGYVPWLRTWFENSAFVKISINEFDLKTVSFTYGDSHPVFSTASHKMDYKEYRRQLYTYDEILKIIDKYGLPQDWNADGQYGPERYVEAHIWCDETINKYRYGKGVFQ